MNDIKFAEQLIARRTYGAPVAPGSDLFRTIYEIRSTQKHPIGGLIKYYEIWLTSEFVEDRKRLKTGATKEQILEFADKYILTRYKENNVVPPEDGAFLSKETGERFGSPHRFPLTTTSGTESVKTTILIPKDIHKWLKRYAVDKETTISDVLKRIVMSFVEQHKHTEEK